MNLIKFRYSNNIDSKFIDNFIFPFFSLIRNLEYNLNANHLLTNIIAINTFSNLPLKLKKLRITKVF